MDPPLPTLQKEENFAAKITADMLPPKDCHCLGDPFTGEDQGDGHIRCLRIKSEDLNLEPVEVKDDMMAKE